MASGMCIIFLCIIAHCCWHNMFCAYNIHLVLFNHIINTSLDVISDARRRETYEESHIELARLVPKVGLAPHCYCYIADFLVLIVSSSEKFLAFHDHYGFVSIAQLYFPVI